MPIPIGPITAVPGVTSSTPLINLGSIQALKISNGSPFDLTISGFGIIGSEIVPAGTEYRLHDNGQNLGALNILPVNNSGISGTGIVNLVAYLVGEKLPEGIWPLTIPTQIVQAKVANVPAVVNDGNPIGTQFLESTVSGAPGSTWSFTNDGNNSFIAVLISNVVHKLIQFANSGNELKLGDTTAGQITEVLSQLTVDQVLNVTKSINLSGASNTVTGTTNGSATAYQLLSGTIKIVIIYYNAYRNSSVTEQQLAIPTPFTTFAWFATTGIPISHPNNSGTNSSNLIVTSLPSGTGAGGTTVESAINGFSYGRIGGAFNQWGLGVSEASNFTEVAIVIGV